MKVPIDLEALFCGAPGNGAPKSPNRLPACSTERAASL